MEIRPVEIDLAKKHVCATGKSIEFLFHRRRYDLMKPAVPSAVSYLDMRSR